MKLSQLNDFQARHQFALTGESQLLWKVEKEVQ